MRPHSRGAMRPSFASIAALDKNKRAQGKPGARCTRGLVCKHAQKNAHEHTGSAEASRPSLRNGFNGFLRALVSAKSARMWERAVLTNRPLLDLSPFVLEGL